MLKEQIILVFSYYAEKRDSEGNYRWYNKFSGEKANCRQCTISNKGEGRKWVNNGVNICQSLQPFEATSSVSIPEGAVSTQENLHRPKSPAENLVEPIRKIDGCRPFESRP